MGGVKLDQWWVAMVVAGVAVFGAGGVGSNAAMAAVGLGLLFVGIGEWINHPYVEGIIGGPMDRWKVSGRPRRPSLGGTIFTVAGAVLLAAGALRVLVSLLK